MFLLYIPLDCPSIQNASVFPSRIKNPVTCNWHGSNYDRLWNNNFFGEGRGTRVSSIKVETDREGGEKTPPGNVDTRRRIALFPEYRKTVTANNNKKKKGGEKKRNWEKGEGTSAIIGRGREKEERGDNPVCRWLRSINKRWYCFAMVSRCNARWPSAGERDRCQFRGDPGVCQGNFARHRG